MVKIKFYLLMAMSTISALAIPLSACATPNVNNNQQEIYKALEKEKARIESIKLSSLGELTQEELDSIDESNILDKVKDQLKLNWKLFEYQAKSLRKNKENQKISFTIRILFEKTTFIETNISVSYELKETNPEPGPNPEPNPGPTEPQPPQPGPEVNPDGNDEKYKDAHTLKLVDMQSATSALKIIEQTPLFKTKVEELLDQITSFNFMYSSTVDKTKKVYELISEIGIYGDWGSDFGEKMKFAPRSWDPDNYMNQKYLPGFNVSSKIIKRNVDLNDLIQKNQFGFLPSNLSQFLYYLKLEDIANLFNVPNASKIEMNFDDEAGTAEILVTDNEGAQNLFKLDSSTSELTKNHDYRQYIYDRSFKVTLPFQAYMKIDKKTVPITQHQATGTSWIIDRIKGPSINQDRYDFLMATNMHVMNFTYGFNKNFWTATGNNYWTYNSENEQISNLDLTNKTYSKYWDGGLISRGNLSQGGEGKDVISKASATSDHSSYDFFSTRNPETVEGVKIYRPNFDDPDKITEENFREVNTDAIKAEDAIDAVWYTPEFTSSGLYTIDENTVLGPVLDINKSLPSWNNKDIPTGYERWEDRRVGKTSNAGADFVISKISLTRDQVKTVLPTLEPLLDTPQEKDWYIGLGNGNQPVETSANSSLFTGGYPEGGWKSLKSTHGRINAQQRYFHDDLSTVQSYWTRYNQEKNLASNDYRGIPNWYDTWFESRTMTPEENQKYMPHGMEVRKVLQQSYMYISDENQSYEGAMKRGASGSMVINSRFELAGILFGWTYTTDDGITIDKQKHTNLVSLIKNYTEENKNLNIIQQVIDKLRSENLTAVKMMSATN